MTELLRLIGASLLVLVLCLILKETGRPVGVYLGIAVGVAASARVITAVGECVSFVGSLAEGTGADAYASVILKAGGVALITDLTSQLCRGAGEGTLGGYVELAGRAELLLLAIPVVKELVELSFGVLTL